MIEDDKPEDRIERRASAGDASVNEATLEKSNPMERSFEASEELS